MEIIFYFFIFVMGTVFGSFFTLAVYRIPLNLNITHERSFCPKCGHKLGFWDLIPVASYISLGGKCRYCGENVRIRYLLLEILSGSVFLLSFLSFKMNFPFFELQEIIAFVAFTFFFITATIILGIDRELVIIDKRVLLFGIITQTAYMLYLYISKKINVHRYEIYLLIMLILATIDCIYLKKTKKSSYFLQILMLIDYIVMYVDSLLIINILIISAFIIAIYYTYLKIKNKKTEEKNKIRIPIGFCIIISSFILIIINKFIS